MAGITFNSKETAKAYNQYAREQMIYRLMMDIRMDLEICELEGWDKLEYINRLKAEIDSIAPKKQDL